MVAPEYDGVSMSPDAKMALAWLVKLERQLSTRNTDLARYDRYYTGDHPLLFTSTKYREAFGGLFTNFADNWTELVVDAVEERLNVEGFRLPSDKPGEKKAWQFWQANDLDAESQLVHTEALINGMAYTLVWPTAGANPLICVEDPREMIVAHVVGSRHQRAAAVKVWNDPDAAKTYGTVYLPGAVWKFERPFAPTTATWTSTGIRYMPPENTTTTLETNGTWTPREVPGETWPLVNILGEVPVVPLYNKPRIRGTGVSEIKNVIPLQDATNKLLADMLVASEFAAFKQRWVTGIELPLDPDTNEPMEPFKAAIDRLWVGEGDSAKFGEFQASDLTNYTGAIELIVQHVASQTRTPPHYFYLSGQFPSGESIKSAETGLVAKARRKMRHFGEGWEETMRLAFKAAGDSKRSGAVALETIWADPESRSESEHIDATVKLRALQIPLPTLWERAGFSPTMIERFKEQIGEMVALGINPVTIEAGAVPVEKAPTIKL